MMAVSQLPARGYDPEKPGRDTPSWVCKALTAKIFFAFGNST
jgi:hypothetical protein